MKKEDQMIDALLKEHARNGNGDDADFLDALEKRLDEEEHVSTMAKPDGKNRSYGIAVGVAAALALGAVGVHHYTKERGFGNQVAMNDSPSSNAQIAELDRASISSAPDADREAGNKVEGQNMPAERNRDDKLNQHKWSDTQPGTTYPDVRKPAPDNSSKVDTGRTPDPVEGGTPNAPVTPGKEGRPTGTALSIPPVETPKPDPKVKYRIDQPHEEAARDAERAPNASVARVPVREYIERKGGDNFRYSWHYEHRRGGFHDDNGPVKPREARSGNRYGALTDNTFKSPWKEPQSTFSVDVDTASYTNIRRLIQGGQGVAKDAVRIEEMINYFSYNYPQPEGKHPFSVNVETASCPWNEKHRLVKVGLKGKEIVREKRPAANLVFLLDVSGSMNSQDKLPLLVESMKILLKELNADDSVSIVVYAGAQGLALPPTYVNDEGRKTILKSLESMRSGGSTNGGAGITLAYKMAKKHFVKGGINRVILGTDGDFNVGVTDNKSLVSMVEREAKSGVFLSVLGFGHGNLNDSMLEEITNKGNGNYSYIDSLNEGRKVFLDDMMGNLVTIAKDVKIQIEFNPAKVSSYRLIGYANRMLKAEDFRNKRIDAGEIGAGHTVTALYEIVPGNAVEPAPVLKELKYQKKKVVPKPADREVVDSPEMLTVNLAYKQPDATKETESTYFETAVIDSEKPWSEASEDFKLSSGVALFGMLLRQSEYAGQGNYELVKKLAEQGRGDDAKGRRTEFSDLVRKVAK